MASAKQLRLFGIAHAVTQQSLHFFLAVPDHRYRRQIDYGLHSGQRPLDHGAAEQRMQYFGQGRLHAGAVTGGENHSSSLHKLLTGIGVMRKANAGRTGEAASAPIEKGLQQMASLVGVRICSAVNKRQRRCVLRSKEQWKRQRVGRPLLRYAWKVLGGSSNIVIRALRAVTLLKAVRIVSCPATEMQLRDHVGSRQWKKRKRVRLAMAYSRMQRTAYYHGRWRA